MKFSARLGIGLAIAIAAGTAIHPSAQAVQFGDGTVAFEQPPSLLDASTTRNEAFASRPTYYFTIQVPATAGEPLQQITITQQNQTGIMGDVDYDLEESRAFLGTRRDREEEIAIADIVFDEDANTVSVMLATPVAPGNIVTIGLRPERNPRYGGVYLFGVTVFPEGEVPRGQFIGYGRLHFYERDGNLFDLGL